MNQGPAYYGDLDEADGKLLAYEREAEEEGNFFVPHIRETKQSYSIFDPQIGRNPSSMFGRFSTYLLIRKYQIYQE